MTNCIPGAGISFSIIFFPIIWLSRWVPWQVPCLCEPRALMRNFTSKQRTLLWGSVTGIDTFPEMFGFQHICKEIWFLILKLCHRNTGNPLRRALSHSRSLLFHKQQLELQAERTSMVRWSCSHACPSGKVTSSSSCHVFTYQNQHKWNVALR